MLCQAAGDDHGEWSKNKEHVWHKKTVHMEGPYGEADVEVECLYCTDRDHWAYVYPTGGGYGYADWDGDGYADNGDAPYGYEWYTYYRTVYYDIWVDPDEYGNDGSGGLPYGGSSGFQYEGSSGYPTEGSGSLDRIVNGEWDIIQPSSLSLEKYNDIIDKFLNSTDARVLAQPEYIGPDRTINVEYDEEKTKGGPGLYVPEDDTIYLGPGATYDIFMREMLHAVDVSKQDPRYRGNAEIAEHAFGREMKYGKGSDELEVALVGFKWEMDRLENLGVADNERMKYFNDDVWKALVNELLKFTAYAHLTKEDFNKDSFNPKPYLDLAYDLKESRKGKVKEERMKLVPVRILVKSRPKN